MIDLTGYTVIGKFYRHGSLAVVAGPGEQEPSGSVTVYVPGPQGTTGSEARWVT
ncbi:hypothetical protein [Faunimonas pinastri]|uniref:hypothetical protein n=1 Tax=Faunimonas pinastri TaxID=1855383 RepID=UPI0015A5CA11|nr:hypothetical protein [Faunimonas pinastri]